MSEQHTPEPWVESWENGGLRVMKETPEGSYTIADVELHDEGRANARRIVACVNACVNFDTKTLEAVADCGGISGGNFGKMRAERDNLRIDKAELLAMLIEARNDVCEAYNSQLAATPNHPRYHAPIKSRLDRLDALIERMTK